MNNFDEIFNATLNLDHTIDVHVHKHYTNCFAKHFYLYCDNVRICELFIKDKRETGHHFHYVLSEVPALTIGSEYRIYDDRYLFCYLDMNVLLQDEKICSLYHTDEVMGAHYHKFYTTFRFFSPLAKDGYVVYCLDGKENILTLEKDSDTGVFYGRVNEDIAGATYYFLVRINGKIISSNDPYAKCLTDQSIKGVVVDPNKVKIDLNENCLPTLDSSTDSIIYEMSIRDMTSFKHTSIRHKGKFLGLTESSCKSKNNNPIGLDYIRYLGVTHVQLLPIFDFCTLCDDNPLESYNWGYDPLYYNSPEGSYCSNPRDPYSKMIELKKMVASFHKAGIRVVMDVVYNHVFNMESSCFEKICPRYYFRYREDGSISNGSFCGNEFNTSHPMARKFIVESCLYWVKEFGIDGFRFDLMGLIDIDTINEVKEKCRLLKSDFIIYGEGWDMPTTLSSEKMTKMYNANKVNGVGFFNDRFRDIVKGKSSDMELAVKGYLLGDYNYIDGFKHVYLGSCIPLAFPPLFNNPDQSINYVECHDNATLFDKIKISNNFENEEDWLKRINLINAATILSFGIPFIHAGQEIGLSKKGVHNSYNAGDNINHFDYDKMDERWKMVEYFKDLVKIRKIIPVFRLKDKEIISKVVSFKNLNEGGLLINYVGKETLPYKSISIIINPSNKTLNYEFENYYTLIFNENGYLNKGVHVKTLQASPLSFNILIED